ncbi:MAG: TonB-dependent receptor plug domain-containing protein [Silanimonas lenta]
MSNIKQLSGAIRFALFAGAASVLAAPAFAQNSGEQEEAKTLDRVEVTGSRISRAQIEGALPVTVIDRQQLELSGDTSVADFLRSTTFNSFGSFRPQSGSSAQSFAELSLRGLGGARTLILVDGRRAPVAPNAGQGQDLNSIPLAAVERIEILSDGASAVYGSDAIGGVVNIITRKDFSGAEIKFGASNPKRPGGETEEGSVVVGISGERGNAVVGASYNNRGIVFQRDRPWSAGGVSSFSNELYNAIAAPGTLYGWRPASTGPQNSTWGRGLPGFACNTNGFFTTGSGLTRRCLYDFTFVAADEAEIRNSAQFARSNFEINDDWSMYFNATTSRVKSFGRYAPVPSSPWPGGGIFIPVGSPNHPAVRFPGQGYDASVPYFLRHRFAAVGNRDTSSDANVYSLDLGFDGRIGDIGVNFGVRRADSQYYEIGRGYLLASAAQAAIADGSYDIYDPFGNDPDLLGSLNVTTNRDSAFVIDEIYASGNMDLFELAGGTAALAFGGEYRKEFYQDLYDSLSEAGVVSGSSGNSSSGSRQVRAVYAEALFPILSNFEINVAARHDRYSDYGSDTSPKISFRYSPLDTLTLRASYGRGFRAPTLDILNASPAFSADAVNDPASCTSIGQPADCFLQVEAYVLANSELGSEDSRQYSFGAVWDATDWLNLSLDYYNISITDGIYSISTSTILQCLAGVVPCPAGVGNLPINVVPPVPTNGLGAARDPVTGAVLYVQRGWGNRDFKTSGLDFNLRSNLEFGDYGSLASQFQLSYVDKFAFDGGRNLADDPSAPRLRAVLQNTWSLGDFSVGWVINYIDDTKSTQGAYIDACAGDPACIADIEFGYPRRLSSWVTHDIQVAWRAPWNGQFVLGAQNLLDKDPVLDPLDPTGRGFDFNLYDGYGRVPYFRYTQNF